MHNLQLTVRSCIQNPLFEKAEQICLDFDTATAFFTISSILYKCDIANDIVTECADLVKEDFMEEKDSNNIVNLSYINEQQSLWIFTTAGELNLYNVLSEQLERIGSIESGVKNAKWSPDNEVLALITGKNSVILMTRNFEPVTEFLLESTDFGEKKPITIGWGKKETQFHGSQGKSAAVNEKSSSKPQVLWDDKLPQITWRDDGQLFAVNSINENERKLRVFSREGILQSTNEAIHGLESPVCWQPNGNITCVQRTPNKYKIIFIEKNGLQHGEFTLQSNDNSITVRELLWNPISTILAIWLDFYPDKHRSCEQVKSSTVQLWTVNNHHWYLKQSLSFSEEELLTAVIWSPFDYTTLYILSQNGNFLELSWSFIVSRSQACIKESLALVGVIDADKVLITPFQQMIIPPPLCAYEVILPAAVLQVVFPQLHNVNDFAAILSDGRVAILKSVGASEVENNNSEIKRGIDFRCVKNIHKLQHILSIQWERGCVKSDFRSFHLHHWTWLTPEMFLTVFTKQQTSVLCILLLKHEASALVVSKTIHLEDVVIKVEPQQSKNGVILQLKNGRLLQYNLGEDIVSDWQDSFNNPVSFTHPCCIMETCLVNGKDIILGLTERHHLFVNSRQIADNCTSFIIHSEFLIFTTLSNKLHCIPLKENITGDIAASVIKCDDNNVRQLERGAKIIICIPEDIKVVLQMPRGNLEAIFPRVLSLATIAKHLDNLAFKDAFMIVRKHHINMNILIDHNPKIFLDNVQKFVEQINNVNWMNVFLNDLQEDDVTKTMYKFFYCDTERQYHLTWDINKIDTVCTKVREALQNHNPDRFLLSILTTYVKLTHPEVDTALQLIQKVKALENSTQVETTSGEALKYLQYLVDTTELYNVALGLYDFDLVLLVAEKSQKDPKEYLSFLNEIRKMEPEYQKFTIDKYLKRPLKALEHISKCGSSFFSECMLHIKTYSLFKEAFKLYPPDSYEYKEVCSVYADVLLEQRNYGEAAILYTRCGNDSAALKAFEKDLNWHLAMALAEKLKFSVLEKAELSRKLAEQLKGFNRHLEAAYLLENYNKDFEESIVTLIQGHLWFVALEQIYRYQRQDIIITHLNPALLEHQKSLVTFFESLLNTYEKHLERLKIIHKEKINLPESLGEFLDNPLDDLASEVGSLSSQRTWDTEINSRSSGRSSKKQRKQARKKLSLKEGNPFEELALVEVLTEKMMTADKMKEECQSCLRTLLLSGYEKEAEELQSLFQTLLDVLQKNRNEIWLSEKFKGSEVKFGPDSTANSISLHAQNYQHLAEMPLDSFTPPKMRDDFEWRLHRFK